MKHGHQTNENHKDEKAGIEKLEYFPALCFLADHSLFPLFYQNRLVSLIFLDSVLVSVSKMKLITELKSPTAVE